MNARTPASILCIICFCGIAVADEKDSRDNSAGHLQWVGDWEVSAAVNRVLGFADPENRLDETWVHPTSFRLSFDKKIGELEIKIPIGLSVISFIGQAIP